MGIIGTLTAAASSMSKVMARRNMEDRLGEREKEKEREREREKMTKLTLVTCTCAHIHVCTRPIKSLHVLT